jgi:hypothetical protein
MGILYPMMKTVNAFARPLAAILLLAAALNSSAQMAPPSHPPMFTAPPEPVLTAPTNWTAAPPSAMVVKSYSITATNGQTAKVAVSAFPGDVGGTFANVNRWRAQIGLPPMDESALGAVTQSITVTGGNATLVDIANPAGPNFRLLAAIVRRGTNTWFYKLMGNNDLVAQEKAPFVKFVQSAVYP